MKGAADLRAYAAAKLEREPRGRGYVCPACGSGSRKDSAFSITRDGRHWECFSCGAGGDVFDLAGAVLGTEDRNAELEEVAGFAGVPSRGAAPRRRETSAERIARKRSALAARARERREGAELEEGRRRHAEGIKAAQARISDPAAVAYLGSRGIGLETARAWGLGYADRSTRYRSPHIVIPYPGSAYYHIDRTLCPDRTPWKYFKWPAAELGPEPLWNPGALDSFAACVVEGQLDALAVQSCGVLPAISLGGHGTRALMAEIERREWRGALVVMQDSDESGRNATMALAGELERAGLCCTVFTYWPWDYGADRPRHKDAAEWFAADRAGLGAALVRAKADALEVARAYYGDGGKGGADGD